MDIRVLHGISGAEQAEGLAVIIDVFRAFSMACYVFGRGADVIVPVRDLETAFRLKKENTGAILIGERETRKPAGFDYGNSPSQLGQADLSGKIIIQTTSSGTQGIAAATGASQVITGSFVNAGAVCHYILQEKPRTLSLVCMGYEGVQETDEDNLFADYVLNTLSGKKSNPEAMMEKIREGTGKRFFLPENQLHSPGEDFYLCTTLDKFDFVLRAEPWKEDMVCLKKITI